MNKAEYKKQINQEQSFYDTSFKGWLIGSDSYRISLYLKCIRWAEWYDNQSGLIAKLLKGWYKYRVLKLGQKLGFQIGLHTCGFGVKFYHWGTVIINKDAKIGRGGGNLPRSNDRSNR